MPYRSSPCPDPLTHWGSDVLSDFSYHMRRSLQYKECHNCILNLVHELSLFINCCMARLWKSFVTPNNKLQANQALRKQKLFRKPDPLFHVQTGVHFVVLYPSWSIPAFTLEKLQVDVTQDGSPQLQDLGQYHLPHFPHYGLYSKDTDSFTKST